MIVEPGPEALLPGDCRETANDALMDLLYLAAALCAKRGSGSAGSGSGRDALPTGRIEVVRVEGDYRPRQIDSADVVAANRPTRALGR